MRSSVIRVLLALIPVWGSYILWDAYVLSAPDDSITITMEDCQATRPGRITNDTDIKNVLAGLKGQKLVKRGKVQLAGETFTLYLPEAKPYAVKNSAANDGPFENKSTLISIDQQGKGQLTDEDGWYANLPLRLGDKMFEVQEIAADGSKIVLRPSKVALSGVVVGRVCPPFSLTTADGKKVTNETFAGKAFLLDVWSVT